MAEGFANGEFTAKKGIRAEGFTYAAVTAESARAAELMEGYKCGYCLNTFENMTDPRVLPCSHVFCLGCLQVDYHFKRRTECPVCKAADVEDLDNLREAIIHDGENSLLADGAPPCNNQDCASPAVSFCVFDGYGFCKKHDKIHEQLHKNSGKHKRIPIKEYMATPGHFTEVYCSTHEDKPLIIVCDNCLQTQCWPCHLKDHECTSTERKYTEFSEMRERLKGEYIELQNQLAAKHREICRLEKMVWRRLDDITSRGREMKKEVDRQTDEQVRAIRETAEVLKTEIDEYMREHTKKSEEFTLKLTENQDYIEDIQHEMKRVIKMAPTSQLISESKERLERINKGLSIQLEKCVLEEKSLTPTEVCRNIELRTRSVIPSRLVKDKSYKVSVGVPDSATMIGKDRIALKINTDVLTMDLSSGTEQPKISCPGLQKITDLAKGEEPNTMIKMYFSDLQATTEVAQLEKPETAAESDNTETAAKPDNPETTAEQGNPEAASPQENPKTATEPTNPETSAEPVTPPLASEVVEKESILLAHDDNKALKIYSMEGNILLTVTTGSSPVTTACILHDHCIIVSFGTSISKYARGTSKVPMWTCEGLADISCIGEDASNGLIYASGSNQQKCQIISPEGELLKDLTFEEVTPQNLTAMSIRDNTIILAGAMSNGHNVSTYQIKE